MLRNENMLRAKAPAIFADGPEDERVSDRYSFLPTTRILEILEEAGWTAYDASQVRSRTWSDKHAKHLVKLRHQDLNVTDFGVGDSYPEILLYNAHNGLGSYKLRGGIFRLICSNGMVIADTDFGTIHIRHIGFEPAQVEEASRQFITTSTDLSDKINTWRSIELVGEARNEFFRQATSIRFENPSQDMVKNIATTRRPQDEGKDLWTALNVAQENLIRGGFRNPDTNRVARTISNLDRDLDINTALWDLTNTFAIAA